MPSGENQVFLAEEALLSSMGHETFRFVRHSDEIRQQGAWGILKGALSTPWNPWAAREMRASVESIRPKVVHIHNTFPLISPSVFHAIGNRAARVMTLHNYRLFCAAAIPMRDGRVCLECIERGSSLPGLKYACYRGSRSATLPLVANIEFHRRLGTWQHQVDAYVVLSEFQREVVVEAGLPARKVHVKPNFCGLPGATVSWADRGDYVVFVGRLSAEKGIRTLLHAWKLWGAAAPNLRVVGDGPLRAELERSAQGMRVEFVGQVTPEAARQQIANARLLVLPSEGFETFGMVVIEAFSLGTPVAVSDLGALPALVEHGRGGLVFRAGVAESIKATLADGWREPQVLQRFGAMGLARARGEYSAQRNYVQLMEIYEQACREGGVER